RGTTFAIFTRRRTLAVRPAPRRSLGAHLEEVEGRLLIAAEVDVEAAAQADVHVDREADRRPARDRGGGDERAPGRVRLDGAEQEGELGVGLEGGAGVVDGDARAVRRAATAAAPADALTHHEAGSGRVDAVLIDVDDVGGCGTVV